MKVQFQDFRKKKCDLISHHEQNVKTLSYIFLFFTATLVVLFILKSAKKFYTRRARKNIYMIKSHLFPRQIKLIVCKAEGSEKIRQESVSSLSFLTILTEIFIQTHTK